MTKFYFYKVIITLLKENKSRFFALFENKSATWLTCLHSILDFHIITILFLCPQLCGLSGEMEAAAAAGDLVTLHHSPNAHCSSSRLHLLCLLTEVREKFILPYLNELI